MCGRYLLDSSFEDYKALYPAWPLTPESQDLPGRWPTGEIAPTQLVPIVRNLGSQLQIDLCHWWIAPAYAPGKLAWSRRKSGQKTFRFQKGTPPLSHFNCRKATLATKPYWRDLLAQKRCLFPVSRFIEWQDDDIRDLASDKWGGRFGVAGHAVYHLAGVWESVKDDEGNDFLSANIVTTEPNELLRDLPHKRMPAILEPDAALEWLRPETSRETALSLLEPYPSELMSVERFLSNPAPRPRSK